MRLDVGDAGQLLHRQLLGLGHQRCPLVRATRRLRRRGDCWVVKAVKVCNPPAERPGRAAPPGRRSHRRSPPGSRRCPPWPGGEEEEEEEVDVVLGPYGLEDDLE